MIDPTLKPRFIFPVKYVKIAANLTFFVFLSSGEQQNAVGETKPLQQADSINAQHKAKKQRLDEPASGGIFTF